MTPTTTTETDTIIDEIHEARRQISQKFGGDISAIQEDARQRQAASGRPVWKPKESQSQTTAQVSEEAE